MSTAKELTLEKGEGCAEFQYDFSAKVKGNQDII